MATRVRFLNDFDGSPETLHQACAEGDERVVSDFAAGQLVGSGNAEVVMDATDPHSPMNIAGVDGKPLAKAEPESKAEAEEKPKATPKKRTSKAKK